MPRDFHDDDLTADVVDIVISSQWSDVLSATTECTQQTTVYSISKMVLILKKKTVQMASWAPSDKKLDCDIDFLNKYTISTSLGILVYY